MAMIRINYNAAVREANRLNSVATDCQSNNTLIDKLIRLVPTYWQGESANAFINELNQWKRKNDFIRLEAKNLGSTIRHIADEIRVAELRAIEAMKKE